MAAVIDCEMTLQGSFLDSVERSKISVTVGGEPCTERQGAGDDVNTVRLLVFISSISFFIIRLHSLLQYVCTPPDQPPGGNTEAPVVVKEETATTHSLHIVLLYSLLQIQVGTNLEFTVGTLMYTDSTQTAQPVNVIIGATVGGVVVAVLLIIAVVVTVALLWLYWYKQNKMQKYNM